ncbi:MAG: NAD-dependent epimerase/dehydratase family protein [Alphaproteobacteria bacterium]|nr:NAD-dependent epimerase/dehydratase family protein [Alphaproteobacteria bacterium]
MKVLITGATGFVGAAVARHFLTAGYQVRCLVRQGSDRRNILDLNVELVEGSLEDEASLINAVKGCEGLLHVAADYRIWVPKPKLMYQANVIGTGMLMEAALKAGVRRIVYTSSVATLGNNKDGSAADEDTPVSENDMIGVYKHSKFLAEEVVHTLIKEQKLPAVIVNPSTPIGPRDIKPTPTGRIIVDSVRGRIPAYVDTGLNIAHVDDVAHGHLLAFQKGTVGQRYILGGENLSLEQILGMIAKEAGFKPPRIKLPRTLLFPVAMAMEGIGMVTGIEPMLTVDALRMAAKKMYFTSKKAEVQLGYTHRPASEAIRDATLWFKSNGYC